MGVSLGDVFNALQVFLGGYYVNDFNEFDRTGKVQVQADSRFRDPGRQGPPPRRSATTAARWCPWAPWPRSAIRPAR